MYVAYMFRRKLIRLKITERKQITAIIPKRRSIFYFYWKHCAICDTGLSAPPLSRFYFSFTRFSIHQPENRRRSRSNPPLILTRRGNEREFDPLRANALFSMNPDEDDTLNFKFATAAIAFVHKGL